MHQLVLLIFLLFAYKALRIDRRCDVIWSDSWACKFWSLSAILLAGENIHTQALWPSSSFSTTDPRL